MEYLTLTRRILSLFKWADFHSALLLRHCCCCCIVVALVDVVDVVGWPSDGFDTIPMRWNFICIAPPFYANFYGLCSRRLASRFQSRLQYSIRLMVSCQTLFGDSLRFPRIFSKDFERFFEILRIFRRILKDSRRFLGFCKGFCKIL